MRKGKGDEKQRMERKAKEIARNWKSKARREGEKRKRKEGKAGD